MPPFTTTMSAPVDLTLYWRPGCGFCMGLMHELDDLGVPYERVDIWESPEGAAFVREHNGGNELVPTVRVGARVLSNPRAAQVLAAVHEQDPSSSLPEPPPPGPVARTVGRILGG